MIQSLARFLMGLAPAIPDPNDPTLRERFNLREFREASDIDRRRFMMAIARSRYESECEMHIHKLFGLSQERFAALLRGKTVMELGCFVGGSVLAHAEAYDVDEMYGVDIQDEFLEAARLYTDKKQGRFQFLKGYGEAIPLPDGSCDAIITQDTIEHVNDVSATLAECYRVLKSSGLLFCVFPSFYHPWGNHLGMVTKVPWLHLLFSDRVIEGAYRQILDRRGEAAYWYRPDNAMSMHRQRFHGVNGITARRFRRLAMHRRFPIVYRNVAPLFSVGRTIQRRPMLKILSLPLKPLASLPVLEEMFLHRACYILQRPPITWGA